MRWRLTLSADGFRVKTEALKGRTDYSRTWDVRFADVDVATLHQWATRKASGESVEFRTKDGKTARFATTTNAAFAREVTEDDRSVYRAAAARVFEAYAAVQPEALVRRGRTPAWRITTAVVLLVQTGLVSGLFLWQAGDVSDGTRFTVLGAIVFMMLLHAIYRVKLFKNPVMVPVVEIAAELRRRAPQVGPWGAAPATAA